MRPSSAARLALTGTTVLRDAIGSLYWQFVVAMGVRLFRSRGKGPSLSQVRGNVYSDKVPGGNLIVALFDRELMTWSDRGGASREFGDRWSQRVSESLVGQIGSERQLSDGERYLLGAVVRLDDDSRIAEQAGRHKLTNPDFVLYGRTADGRSVVQAADAKFAVDTIKPLQVSAESLQALLDVENGLARQALEREIDDPEITRATATRGVFISPIGPLTDYFLPRLLSDRNAVVDAAQIELISADPLKLFANLVPSRLIGPLARIDQLPVSPRVSLLAAMYYFRVACACSWMWVEDRTPLLTREAAPEVDPEQLVNEVADRATSAHNAFNLVSTWFERVEDVTRNRKSLQDVMALPVRMAEIREMVKATGAGEDRRMVRLVRAALDRQFRYRAIDLVGEVPAHPEEPIGDLLLRAAQASRTLGPEMHRLALELVAEYHAERSPENSSASSP